MPAFLRWPAKWQAGVTLNGIVAHQDMLTTFLAAAGEPDVAAKCRAGHEAGGKTFKVILDGKDMNAYLAGEADESPRDRFFYVNDDGRAGGAARRRLEVHLHGAARQDSSRSGSEPFVELRVPKIVNLRRDPFERALEDSNTYYDWMIDRIYMIVPAQAAVAEAIEEFAEFPPRQKPASFSLDRVLEKLQEVGGQPELSRRRGPATRWLTGRCRGVRRAAPRAAGRARRRRSREEVSQALIDAAAELFAERPSGRVTVREIAARADVNPALVHRYFASKQNLMRAAMEQSQRAIAANLSG